MRASPLRPCPSPPPPPTRCAHAAGVLASWVLSDAAKKHRDALELLERLQLLTTLLGQAGDKSYLLHRTFQAQVRAALCTG